MFDFCAMEGRLWNGLATEAVERRCRALEDKSDPEWPCMSSVGFLAPGERLEAVVARDAAALARLGLTAAQLAERLRALLMLFGDAQEGAVTTAEGARVRFVRRWFVGAQYSPFRNSAGPMRRHEEGWSDEWKVRSDCASLVLTRGGLDMLEDFGFCQGGLDGSSRYRLDPDAVVALLSGNDSPGAESFRNLRKAFRNAKRREQREALLRDMRDRMHEEGADEFLQQQLKKLAEK
jgi:hypothetical protein